MPQPVTPNYVAQQTPWLLTEAEAAMLNDEVRALLASGVAKNDRYACEMINAAFQSGMDLRTLHTEILKAAPQVKTLQPKPQPTARPYTQPFQQPKAETPPFKKPAAVPTAKQAEPAPSSFTTQGRPATSTEARKEPKSGPYGSDVDDSR